MKPTRRALLISSAAALSFGPAFVRAAGAEFKYKFGVDLPSTHPTATWMQKAAERIKVETNGRLEIQVFPNSALGASTDMISQVRSGALEFHAQSGPGLSQLVPATGLNSMGFAFKSEEEIWSAMDGALGKAPLGGELTGPNPTDRAKKGRNGASSPRARASRSGSARPARTATTSS